MDGQIGGSGVEFQRITDPAPGNGDGQVFAAVAKVKAEAGDAGEDGKDDVVDADYEEIKDDKKSA